MDILNIPLPQDDLSAVAWGKHLAMQRLHTQYGELLVKYPTKSHMLKNAMIEIVEAIHANRICNADKLLVILTHDLAN